MAEDIIITALITGERNRPGHIVAEHLVKGVLVDPLDSEKPAVTPVFTGVELLPIFQGGQLRDREQRSFLAVFWGFYLHKPVIFSGNGESHAVIAVGHDIGSLSLMGRLLCRRCVCRFAAGGESQGDNQGGNEYGSALFHRTQLLPLY